MAFEMTRYHVELLHDEVRLRTFWVMSNDVVAREVVDEMMPGILDAVDMFIGCPPLMFIKVSELPEHGRISKQSAFIRPEHIKGLPPVFIVNTEFWNVTPGHDNFYAQLVELGVLWQGDFRETLVHLEKTFNLHVIGV